MCGYCSSQYHGDHLKDLIRVKQFRETSLKGRGSMNHVLAEFTLDIKRNLLDFNLYEVIRQKQQDLIRQFEQFLTLQHDQLLKLIDANVENYLFEEQEVECVYGQSLLYNFSLANKNYRYIGFII